MNASFPRVDRLPENRSYPTGNPAATPGEIASLLARPEGARLVLLGVDYLHLKTCDGGDLYLTCFGLPFWESLQPENWSAPDWFAGHRQRLAGTSTIYRIPTRTVRGVSLDLVVRFSRVGQPVPADTLTTWKHIHAEFNSPFEEFATVLQLRASQIGPARPRIRTKKPLAIYVPAARLQRWQTGRSESKIAAKQAQHPEVPLDFLRQYILLYGWIDGHNAVQAADALKMPPAARASFLADSVNRAISDLAQHGFRMLDVKPEHLIFRIGRAGALLRRQDGPPAYALVDYELLECTRAQ